MNRGKYPPSRAATMPKSKILRRIYTILIAFILLLIVTGWIFYKFYLDDALNHYLKPQLVTAFEKATDGKYKLQFGTISYVPGSIRVDSLSVIRIGYDSSEHGWVVSSARSGTIEIHGINLWDALWGNSMKMRSLEIFSPRIHFAELDSERMNLKLLRLSSTSETKDTSNLAQAISFDSVVFRNGDIEIPGGAENHPVIGKIAIKLTDFLIDPKDHTPHLPLFSKNVDFSITSINYPMEGGEYGVEVRGLRGNAADSILHIDSFAYRPQYSKEKFPTLHKYVQPRLEFQCSGIDLNALHFNELLSGGRLRARSCTARSWSFDFYSDRRFPNNPHPPVAVLPNDIVRSIKFPIDLDSIVVDHGTMYWAEKWPAMRPGTLIFTDARIALFPFITDSLNPNFQAPTAITVSALFQDEARLRGLASYALHDKEVNFEINATVGGLTATKLNTELIPVERLEVTDGAST
ncbi:MAG: hypothetical protein ABI778_10720, partial [Ignavibacteriota bacterium]